LLYSLASDEYIDDVPHGDQYDLWRSRLSLDEYRSIMSELAGRIEGNAVLTSSWIPGADWSLTPFHAIYENACREDHDASRRFFGLLVRQAFLEDDDVWAFGRYEKDGRPIEGLTYFRLSNPRPRRAAKRTRSGCDRTAWARGV
jgi:hypothetical protein